MNSTKWIIGIIVVIIIAIGAYLMLGTRTTNAPAQTATVTENQPQTPETVSSSTSAAPTHETVTVTLTDQGFSPANVTIHAGDSVTWVNQSGGKMWVASAMHPSHVVYDGTDRSTHCASSYTGPAPFDECDADGTGQSFTFTFDKAGTWKYHNHVNASEFGSVTVQ